MRSTTLTRLASLALVLALTSCGSGTGDDTTTTAAGDTTATPETTTEAPATEALPDVTFAEQLTGYYTCGTATLELFSVGGVLYGEMAQPQADGTTSYWGLVIDPVNPGEFEKKGVDETRVRITQYSAEDLGGSVIGDPAAYTLSITATGVELCDHTSGTPLLADDTDMTFVRTAAPAPEASPLQFDAAAAKEAGILGAWHSSFTDGKGLAYDVTLLFRENGRVFCRIEVDGQLPNIWMGDYALPTAADNLASGTVICSATRKGANKTAWLVHVTCPAQGGSLYLRGIKSPTGTSLLNLTCTLSQVEDNLVIPTLG